MACRYNGSDMWRHRKLARLPLGRITPVADQHLPVVPAQKLSSKCQMYRYASPSMSFHTRRGMSGSPQMGGNSLSFSSHGIHTPGCGLGAVTHGGRPAAGAAGSGSDFGDGEDGDRYTPYSSAAPVIARRFSTVASFWMMALASRM